MDTSKILRSSTVEVSTQTSFTDWEKKKEIIISSMEYIKMENAKKDFSSGVRLMDRSIVIKENLMKRANLLVVVSLH